MRQLLSLAGTLANLLGDYQKADQYGAEASRLMPGSAIAETEEELPRGGTLVVALVNAINTLDPSGCELLEEAEILTNV